MPNLAFADWFCKEASSQQYGDTILSCGVATSSDLQIARNSAFESAKDEFARLCNQSVNCRDYEVIVKPMRTDCSKQSDSHTCYRALEYHITNKKKKDVPVNIDEVESLINRKQKEIDNLKINLSILEEKARLDAEASSLKEQIKSLEVKIETNEVALIPYEDKVSSEAIAESRYKYVRDLFNASAKAYVGYNGTKFQGSNESLFYGGIEIEKRFYKKFGISFFYEWGSNFDSEDPPNQGTPNGSATTKDAIKASSFGLGAQFYLHGHFYARGEIGQTSMSQEVTVTNFSALGTKQSANTTKNKQDDTFQGLSIGYDYHAYDKDGLGFYFEIGARKYPDSINPKVTLGINFGF